MTREEAIYLLRNTAWLAPTLEPVEEAVEMASEALKERPRGIGYTLTHTHLKHGSAVTVGASTRENGHRTSAVTVERI